MPFLEIVFIGIGLSMDAFTVAMGMSSTLHCFRNRLFLSFLFGLFQALMILLGYSFGSFFPFISTFKNFFSCCLLSYVGIHMIYDSFLKTEYPSFSFLSSLFLAVATSIDAFCVGFQFSFLFCFSYWYDYFSLLFFWLFFRYGYGKNIGTSFSNFWRSYSYSLWNSFFILILSFIYDKMYIVSIEWERVV